MHLLSLQFGPLLSMSYCGFQFVALSLCPCVSREQGDKCTPGTRGPAMCMDRNAVRAVKDTFLALLVLS
jgi:hypothetical protein